jgi:acetoin utilization deacetylase AcuC-like enzyme
MDVIFSEEHRRQDGASELIGGKLQPPVERPERAERIREAVRAAGIGPEHAPDRHGLEPLLRVHDEAYVTFLAGAWARWTEAGRDWDALPLNWVGRGMRHVPPETIDGLLSYYSFDAGTPIGSGSWAAARASADVALTGAERLLAGAPDAFSLCRPPGHHAARDYFGGYCFLNNAALAAQRLRDGGPERVALLDVDYHHGNGTQTIFYDRPDVLTVSIHADPRLEFPFFIGLADETGAGAGEGRNRNLPLPWGTTWSGGYADALDTALATVHDFGPEALVVSLGVDTYEHDPISRFKLVADDYAPLGAAIRRLGRPTLFVMEGGYHLDSIGPNVASVLRGFLDG